jgi:hypothetical protein
LLLQGALTNAAAAFIGPTVCELDGPKPILKISPMLIMSAFAA